MILYRCFIFLLLFKCVFVYSKNRTTYTLNPHLSQVKLLSLPKNALFLGSLHRNSGKNKLKNKVNTRFLHEEPDDENDTQVNEASEQPENAFLDESSSDGLNSQENMSQGEDSYDTMEPNNQNYNYSDESSNDSNEAKDNKQLVDDIAKEEHMKQMNSNAGQMLDSAKQAKEKAEELLNQFKQGSYTSETNKHAMPKDEAGNIIITNTTTTPTPKKEEEKVDPLKSIRDATLSLFERARHKNLPVPDPGHLSTPEQIYAALNSLEYIIDGYRYSKIEVMDRKPEEGKANESEGTYDTGEKGEQPGSTDDSESPSSMDEEDTIMDPDRFLQVKHKNYDDEDEGEDGMNEDEGEDKDYDFHKDESEEGDQDNEEESDGADSSENEKSDKKGATLSPQQAVEDLKGVLNKLTAVLEQVVQDNIGVKNVIMKSE